MCIASSVGRGARNDLADVAAIQILLNVNLHRFPDPRPAALETDGRIGRKTLECIERFETSVMGLPESDALVVPGDATVVELLKGLPSGPTKDKLTIVLPLAARSRIDLNFEPLKAGMIKYGITSPLQMAHFIAQLGHESMSFLYTEEIASGAAYEGRTDLGNMHAGDGRRYKGRGLIQLTGRANYAAYSRFTGIDYVAQPEPLSCDPVVAVDVSCWFWKDRGVDKLAEMDDAKAVTKRINGGYNGLDDRLQNLRRAKSVLGL
ncbi:MAG: glycoside hydrolase family 19 protein [Burkholderiaceae bacterium]